MFRKCAVSLAVLILLALEGLAGAAITEFDGDGNTVIVRLPPPEGAAVVNISVPADAIVLSASMRVAGPPADGCLTDFPVAPSVALGQTILWAFDGANYGALGRQTVLSNGSASGTAKFGPGGGAADMTIHLPKNATVVNATAALDCSRDGVHVRQVINFSGEGIGDQFGYSVASAGDVNNDGYNDLLVGALMNDAGNDNAGRAYLYYSNRTLDTVADLKASGSTPAEYLGVSVSGAGDVNGDGFDDFIVGVSMNDAGGTNCGRAYLFLGGPGLDSTPDVTYTGTAAYNYFGGAVAGAGDVNGDGYDDVIVGAASNNDNGVEWGKAYIYFGGKSPDSTADVVLAGTGVDRQFGIAVAGAGDVNGDGYGDVIVGEFRYSSTNTPAGRATIFFGAKAMDSTPDVVLKGTNPNDAFGTSVSTAGDVNKDGYADVIIGARNHGEGAWGTGTAYIFLGGKAMDSQVDLQLNGPAVESEGFGWSVSTAGDLDRDGYSDVVVGSLSNSSGGPHSGCARVFFGGQNMDSKEDAFIPGNSQQECFGRSSAAPGDINGDGYDELFFGADMCSVDGTYRGRAYVYTIYSPMESPAARLGNTTLFAKASFDGSAVLDDFAPALNARLREMAASWVDAHGNEMVDIGINLSAASDGNITLSGINITYRYDAAVPDFSGPLNSYIAAHRGDAGPDGNLSVPLVLKASGPGRLVLSGLGIEIDRPPALEPPIPDLWMDEDSENATLLDLRAHFADDRDAPGDLVFWLESATNSSFVNLSVRDNRYLSADALTGGENDNWTGVVEAQVGCRDSRNLSRLSNPFNLTIRNVNDPPLITSAPPAAAMFRKDFAYTVTAVDGDRDALAFSLANPPAGMTIESATGAISWLPAALGRMNVSVSVSDGQAAAWQNFTVTVSSNPDNRAPRFISQPSLNATAGSAYSYDADALDDDADPLAYSLREAPAGMSIDGASGRISWTPAAAGTFPVSVTVTDGQSNAYQDFTLTVREGGQNRAPRFITTAPGNATAGQEYSYAPSAADDDGDNLTFSLVSGPAGMAVNSTSGRISWVPQSGQAGAHNVTIAVSDEHGLRAEQSFAVEVSAGNAGARPDCAITAPVHLEKVRGRITLKGTAAAGSARVTRVDVRIDGGDWVKAAGTDSWSFTVDTRQLQNGQHRFEVRSYDDALYSDTAAVDVTVSNAKAAPAPDNTLLIYAIVAMALGAAAVSVLVIVKRKKRSEPTTVYPPAGAYAPQYPPAPPYGGAPVQWAPQPAQPGPPPPMNDERAAYSGQRAGTPAAPAPSSPVPPPQPGPLPPQEPPAIPPPEG